MRFHGIGAYNGSGRRCTTGCGATNSPSRRSAAHGAPKVGIRSAQSTGRNGRVCRVHCTARAEDGQTFGLTLNAVGRISCVGPGSCAKAAGLQCFDRISLVDGHPPVEPEQLAQGDFWSGRTSALIHVERPPWCLRCEIAAKESELSLAEGGPPSPDLSIQPATPPRAPAAMLPRAPGAAAPPKAPGAATPPRAPVSFSQLAHHPQALSSSASRDCSGRLRRGPQA